MTKVNVKKTKKKNCSLKSAADIFNHEIERSFKLLIVTQKTCLLSLNFFEIVTERVNL